MTNPYRPFLNAMEKKRAEFKKIAEWNKREGHVDPDADVSTEKKLYKAVIEHPSFGGIADKAVKKRLDIDEIPF